MFRKTFPMFSFRSRSTLPLKQPTAIDWVKQDKILIEPFEYLKRAPSKHPAMLVPTFNHWLQLPEDKMKSIQDLVDAMIRWVTILDDIVDDSALRYGVPSTHQVYGIGLTINATNKALVLIQKQILELGHPATIEIFLKYLDEHCQALGTETYWRDHNICPTEEAVLEMIRKKSTTFVFPVKLMQLFSSNKNNYTELAANLGSFYYLLDDYYNLFQPKGLEKMATIKQEDHQSCSDITECKMSLAVVHASQFPDVATELIYILKQRTSDPKLHSRAISLLKKHGSDEYVRNELKKLEEGIRTEIAEYGGNPYFTKILDSLHF